MENVYEIVKLKQEIKIHEDFPPLNTKSVYSIVKWLQEEIGYDTQENLVLLCLDSKNNLNSFSFVHRGTINQSIAHPRDIFQRAILSNAARIIIAHNHPSNDPNPSEADNRFTDRVKESSDVLGIGFLDHVIVGYDTYFSYREHGYLVE